MMAIFFPLNSFCNKIPATVISSFLPLQRIIPAFLNKASIKTSELAIAPVCEDAALFPASELPALIAAIYSLYLLMK